MRENETNKGIWNWNWNWNWEMLEAVSIQLKIDRFMTAKLFRVRIVHWGGWVRDSCLHYQLAQPLFLEKGEKGEKIGTGRIGGLNGHP